MSRARPLPDPVLLVVFDFDGVFTDNKVYTADDGTETVMCDRRDGLGVKMLRERGIDMFILSLETNPVVEARARKLGLAVETGCEDKAAFLARLLERRVLDPANVVYMGNDVNDLDAMKLAGFGATPADAHPAVLKTADLVVSAPGGHGAVRELCEIILKTKEGT